MNAEPSDLEDGGSAAAPPRSGCLRAFGCFGAVVIVLGLLVLIALKVWIPKWAADQVAEVGHEELAKLELPEPEQQALAEPIDLFAERIRRGQVKILRDGEAIAERARSHPALPLLAARGFLSLNVARQRQGDELAAAHLTVNRFMQAVLAGTVADADLRRLASLVAWTRPEAAPLERFGLRDDCSPAEVAEALAIMEQVADAAGIPDVEVAIDLPAQLDDLLNQKPAEAL